MALINWNESFSVKISDIDRQHQKLIDMINDLSEAMKDGRGKEVQEKIIKGLLGYTISHFQNEQKYFKLYNYPDADAHIKEHDMFVQKVKDFQQGFKEGKLSLSLDLMRFLSDWLRNHIQGTDKKYTEFFLAQGLK